MRYKFSNKIYLLIPALFTFLLWNACSSPQPQADSNDGPRKNQSATYTAIVPEKLNPEYTLSLPGELKPYEQVSIYAKTNGFIKQLLAERGDKVRRGQLLAVLEAPEMSEKFLSDKSVQEKMYSEYVFAKQAYDRLLDASKTDGAVAPIELDRAKNLMSSAKSAYESSKASTAQSAQLREYLRITAPFDGIITDRTLSVGALVGTGNPIPLFQIAQGNRLRLTVSLPEKHASSVQDAMKAQFSISAQPDKTYQAKLSRTSELLSQQDRSLTLEFDVDNSDRSLQGGDYALVKLSLKRTAPSLWIPSKSILQTQSGSFVLSLKQQQIKRIPVKEGIRLDSITEIFGNITVIDSLIKHPTEEIQEGKIN